MELVSQIEDLREKLAQEFNKKRRMKQDAEERIAALNEELHYYREVKCGEMRDLLANCKQELKEFEELNLLRNDVIERLENENMHLRALVPSSSSSSTPRHH